MPIKAIHTISDVTRIDRVFSDVVGTYFIVILHRI